MCLSRSDMFDGRLAAIVLKVVDVSYGGENGFNQAIELAADTLSSVKFIQVSSMFLASMFCYLCSYLRLVDSEVFIVCVGEEIDFYIFR